MADVIFITSRLDVNHGGLTSSLLNKAGILYDEKNIKSIILTFHAGANFNRVKSDILERYNLKNKVDIFNLNEFFRDSNVTKEFQKYAIDTSDYTPIKITDKKYEFYNNGLKILEIFYNKDQIKEVKHFDKNNMCISKDVLDNDGYLYWQSYYLNQILSRQVFFRKDQTPFLTREFDAINQSDKINSLVLFQDKPIRFNSFNNLKEYFINHYIKEPITYLVGEARGLDPVIMNINNSNVRKIFMTHSIHIRPNTDIIRAGNRAVLNNLNNIDALVLLTNKQKEDIKNRFGNRDNYYVIPHSITIPNITEKKIDKKVVIISRLHPEKRLDHSIKAFKKVSANIPDAKLYIYGDGQEKNKLQNLIESLKLENNVKLMGYSNEVNKILQSAECSLLTSQYEGFALSIQESLANGTPVIAYDIKYGPSDMIVHDKNGYLIDNNNINDLSSHIIQFLEKTNTEKKSYYNAAIEKAKEFSHQNFANSWNNLFNDLKTQSNDIQPTVKLIDLKRSKLNKFKYKIYLEVKLNSENDINPIFKGSFSQRSMIDKHQNKFLDTVSAKTISSDKDLFVIEIEFDTKLYQKREIYDLSLLIENKDKFFELKIHEIPNSINFNSLTTRKCKPFFTDKYQTLSFKL